MATSKTLLEKEIDEYYKKVVAGEKRGRNVGTVRRIIAYVLKIIAAGGSLIVATGRWPENHQAIGIAILVAVLLDSVSSNHKRLLAEVKAGYAYAALHHRVKSYYNGKLGSAGVDTQKLQQEVHSMLSDGIASVQAKLAETDVAALEALSLDNERAAAAKA
jgi:hypothetical protein